MYEFAKVFTRRIIDLCSPAHQHQKKASLIVPLNGAKCPPGMMMTNRRRRWNRRRHPLNRIH